MGIYSEISTQTLHSAVGLLVKSGSRLLITVITLGTVFCVITSCILQLSKSPEQTLYLKTFMFNYSEFSRVATRTGTDALKAARPEQTASNGRTVQQDPNWDGVLAGASLGYTLGRNVPFIGSVGGPLLGMAIGYQMDSRI